MEFGSERPASHPSKMKVGGWCAWGLILMGATHSINKNLTHTSITPPTRRSRRCRARPRRSAWPCTPTSR